MDRLSLLVTVIFVDITSKSLEIIFILGIKTLQMFQVFRYQTIGVYINVVVNKNFWKKIHFYFTMLILFSKMKTDFPFELKNNFNGYIAATAKLLQSCPTLCDPTDGSPPGSPVPGILQARTLEWVAISFSNA